MLVQVEAQSYLLPTLCIETGSLVEPRTCRLWLERLAFLPQGSHLHLSNTAGPAHLSGFYLGSGAKLWSSCLPTKCFVKASSPAGLHHVLHHFEAVPPPWLVAVQECPPPGRTWRRAHRGLSCTAPDEEKQSQSCARLIDSYHSPEAAPSDYAQHKCAKSVVTRVLLLMHQIQHSAKYF